MEPALIQLYEDGAPEDIVPAILKLGSFDDMPPGVRIVSKFGTIVTVRLRRGDIPGIRTHASVASMKRARPLLPEMPIELHNPPVVMARTNANERRPQHERATGRNVVVGVVDWGFDFAHPDFRHPDGRTRLLALWDQSAPLDSSRPNRYGYGVIHLPDTINLALSSSDPYGSLAYSPVDSDIDNEGTHATHVTSIAAGNGQAGGPLGVAPAADLVFVHLATSDENGSVVLGDSAALLEAIDFIMHVADSRPWVINLSMGRCGEQHDGTTLVEQGLDAAVAAEPGRAIVQSTGNYFGRQLHSSGYVGPGEECVLLWQAQEGISAPNELEIWYSGRDILSAEVRAPDGTLVGRADPNQQAQLLWDDHNIGTAFHRMHEPNNLDNHILIYLTPPLPAGSWSVTLVGRDIVDGRFHAWIERIALRPQDQMRFAPENAVSLSTTGSICNGLRTIAVGAYDVHSLQREVASFSSCGPTRDGRLKPDLVAPGVSILAARSAPSPDQAGQPLLTTQTGTSMAAPHVTGTIALMFEVAPRLLRIEETHNLLLTSTDKPAVAQGARMRYGSGYLNIDAAVHAAHTFVPLSPTIRTARVEEAHMANERFREAGPWFNIRRRSDEADDDEGNVILDCRGCETASLTDDIPQAEPTPATTLAEVADALIGTGGITYAEDPDALLPHVLAQAGLSDAVGTLASQGLLSPATVFDAFTSFPFASLRPHLEPIFVIIAAPKQPLTQPLQAGDVLLRRALGEPGLGYASFIGQPTLCAPGQGQGLGWRLESTSPGWYVPVVDGGAFPHRIADSFARRVAGSDGWLPPDTLILRPRLPTAVVS